MQAVRRDWIGIGVGIALVAMAAGIAAMAGKLPPAEDRLGSAFLPYLVAVGLAVLGVLTLTRAMTGKDIAVLEDPIVPEAVWRLPLALAALAIFYTLLVSTEGLGIPVLGPILVVALGVAFGGRLSITLGLASILIAEITYSVFRYWFNLPLPPSAWF